MMENSDKIIHCLKCKKITVHHLLDTYKVRCLVCGSIKDLKNPHTVEAEIAIQGNPEDA
ncbi:MAG: hypothetical protein KAT69_09525 [Candidatus Aminicenantes bacterium]|nr:hypothetical protein [Candidatus Aminicenantes bacterium]